MGAAVREFGVGVRLEYVTNEALPPFGVAPVSLIYGGVPRLGHSVADNCGVAATASGG